MWNADDADSADERGFFLFLFFLIRENLHDPRHPRSI